MVDTPHILAFCSEEGEKSPGKHLAFILSVKFTVMLNVLQQELVQALQRLFLHRALTVHHHGDDPHQPSFLKCHIFGLGLGIGKIMILKV